MEYGSSFFTGMIYFLNAVMCLYLVIVLFRRHNGKALIMSVKFIPDSFLYSYIIYQISKLIHKAM